MRIRLFPAALFLGAALKTAFGLVGWIRVEPWTVDAAVVEGLFYAGD